MMFFTSIGILLINLISIILVLVSILVISCENSVTSYAQSRKEVRYQAPRVQARP